jgi:hypothetical protein
MSIEHTLAAGQRGDATDSPWRDAASYAEVWLSVS